MELYAQGTSRLVVERSAPGRSLDDRMLAGLAVAGIWILEKTLFRPLAVETTVTCHDTSSGSLLDGPEHPYRQLRVEDPPTGLDLDPMYARSQVEQTRTMDATAVLAWLERATSIQCPGPDAAPGWSELVVNVVDARLPVSLDGGGPINVGYGSGALPYPTRHGRQLGGGPAGQPPRLLALHRARGQRPG